MLWEALQKACAMLGPMWSHRWPGCREESGKVRWCGEMPCRAGGPDWLQLLVLVLRGSRDVSCQKRGPESPKVNMIVLILSVLLSILSLVDSYLPSLSPLVHFLPQSVQRFFSLRPGLLPVGTPFAATLSFPKMHRCSFPVLSLINPADVGHLYFSLMLHH